MIQNENEELQTAATTAEAPLAETTGTETPPQTLSQSNDETAGTPAIKTRKELRLEKKLVKREAKRKKKEEKRAKKSAGATNAGAGANGESSVYIPKIEFVFPEKTDEQIIEVDHKRKIKLDKKYYDRLTKVIFKIGQFFFKIIFYTIAFPLVRMRYHLKVEGRKELKPYMKLLKKEGFITVSNHVFLWDYVALCAAMRMGVPKVPAWGKIIYSKFGGWFSLAGVVPIPNDRTTFKKFYEFIGNIFKHNRHNKWMHIYPETGLWYYYVPIRPFKRGGAVFAYQYDKPIVPVGYSFRERTGISKLWQRKHPFVTVHISEPIWPDKTKEKREAVDELNEKVRLAVMHSVGIKDEEENQRLMNEYKYEDGHYYTQL